MNIEDSLSTFQFIGSSVKKYSIENTFVQYDEFAEMQKKNFELDYDDPDIAEVNGDRVGVIDLYVKVQVESEDRSLDISLTLQGAFKASKEMPEEDFKRFITLNGCTTLYGIARAYIMSNTAQSFVGGNVVLPMVNMLEHQKKREEAEQ